MDRSLVTTVRIFDWRREPYFAIDECPTGVDIPQREYARFQKEFEFYKAEKKHNGPRQIKSKHGLLTLTKVRIRPEALKLLVEAVDKVFNKHNLGVGNVKGKSAFIYSMVHKHYNIKNNVVVAIFEELNVDVSYPAMADFLAPQISLEGDTNEEQLQS